MDKAVLFDSKALENFIIQRQSLIEEYEGINNDFLNTIHELCDHWHGYGASAFRVDTERITANLRGIGDIMNTMCDTLEDCLDLVSELDASLGNANKSALTR